MTKYICGLFDIYSYELITTYEVNGVNNTKDATSKFIEHNKNNIPLAGESYYLCVTTERQTNKTIYEINSKLMPNNKLVTSVYNYNTLDEETVNVLISRTLSAYQ